MSRKKKPANQRIATARFAVVIKPELLAACQAAADKTGVSLSDWLRRVTAKAAGRPDLAETPRPGKPKSDAA